jgi:predicted RNA-binding Zn ribbon-like protein
VNIEELPLVGGHPALDLVNTKERGIPGPEHEEHDFLVDADGLLLWARRTRLIDDAEAERVDLAWAHDPGSAAAALDSVRELRESLHAALLAATGLVSIEPADRDAALENLHARWLATVGRAKLVIETGGEPPVRLIVGTEPASLLVDRAANAALDVLRSDDLERLRRCPLDSGGCGWLFLDRTRNRSRRWCRMADCGTHVKARRLTERRRAARASSPSTRPASSTSGRNRP